MSDITKQALSDLMANLEANDIVIRDLDATVAALNEKEGELNDKILVLRRGMGALEDKNSQLLGRARDVEARELKCLGLEIRNEYEKRRGDEFKELQLATVRNATIRRNLWEDKLTPVSGSKDCVGYVQRDTGVLSSSTETEE